MEEAMKGLLMNPQTGHRLGDQEEKLPKKSFRQKDLSEIS